MKLQSFSNVLGESIKGIRQVKAYNKEGFRRGTKQKIQLDLIKKYFIKAAYIVSNRLSPLNGVYWQP